MTRLDAVGQCARPLNFLLDPLDRWLLIRLMQPVALEHLLGLGCGERTRWWCLWLDVGCYSFADSGPEIDVLACLENDLNPFRRKPGIRAARFELFVPRLNLLGCFPAFAICICFLRELRFGQGAIFEEQIDHQARCLLDFRGSLLGLAKNGPSGVYANRADEPVEIFGKVRLEA